MHKLASYFNLILSLSSNPSHREPGPTSLALAKYNLVKHYTLVGFIDDLASFVEGLERLLPEYFKTGHDFYKKHGMQTNT